MAVDNTNPPAPVNPAANPPQKPAPQGPVPTGGAGNLLKPGEVGNADVAIPSAPSVPDVAPSSGAKPVASGKTPRVGFSQARIQPLSAEGSASPASDTAPQIPAEQPLPPASETPGINDAGARPWGDDRGFSPADRPRPSAPPSDLPPAVPKELPDSEPRRFIVPEIPLPGGRLPGREDSGFSPTDEPRPFAPPADPPPLPPTEPPVPEPRGFQIPEVPLPSGRQPWQEDRGFSPFDEPRPYAPPSDLPPTAPQETPDTEPRSFDLPEIPLPSGRKPWQQDRGFSPLDGLGDSAPPELLWKKVAPEGPGSRGFLVPGGGDIIPPGVTQVPGGWHVTDLPAFIAYVTAQKVRLSELSTDVLIGLELLLIDAQAEATAQLAVLNKALDEGIKKGQVDPKLGPAFEKLQDIWAQLVKLKTEVNDAISARRAAADENTKRRIDELRDYDRIMAVAAAVMSFLLSYMAGKFLDAGIKVLSRPDLGTLLWNLLKSLGGSLVKTASDVRLLISLFLAQVQYYIVMCNITITPAIAAAISALIAVIVELGVVLLGTAACVGLYASIRYGGEIYRDMEAAIQDAYRQLSMYHYNFRCILKRVEEEVSSNDKVIWEQKRACDHMYYHEEGAGLGPTEAQMVQIGETKCPIHFERSPVWTYLEVRSVMSDLFGLGCPSEVWKPDGKRDVKIVVEIELVKQMWRYQSTEAGKVNITDVQAGVFYTLMDPVEMVAIGATEHVPHAWVIGPGRTISVVRAGVTSGLDYLAGSEANQNLRRESGH